MSTREELTRQAERCLRQGRVDDAIAHYQALAVMAPIDWGQVKQLADLLERAGQCEGAAVQFCRWADHLFTEGFHSKAAALYKKVLKLDTSHEHALWQLAEVSLELKLRADARVAFQRVVDLRQRRNDAAGVAAARARLAELDALPVTGPVGFVAPGSSAPPAAALPARGVPAAAAAPVTTAPAWSSTLAPPSAAVTALAPMDPLPPPETREARLARLRREAEAADAAQAADADARWQALLEADPQDAATRLRLVVTALDRDDLERAERLASPLDPAQDQALIVLSELAYRRGQHATIDQVISSRVHAGASPEHVLAPVGALATRQPGAARAVLAAAVTAWSAAGQPGHAARALEDGNQRGLLTTPLHLQWVEICVDAGLPELSRAQHALARGYLAAGQGAEARAVAEDLFVREGGAEPWRGLLLDILDHQGVADPHRVLVDLLLPPSEAVGEEEVEAFPVTGLGDASLPPPETTASSDDAAWTLLDLDERDPSLSDPLFGWPAEAPPASHAVEESALTARAASHDFDWADLLGRYVDIGHEPSAVEAPVATAPDPTLALDLSPCDASVDLVEQSEPATPAIIASPTSADLADEAVIESLALDETEMPPPDVVAESLASTEAVGAVTATEAAGDHPALVAPPEQLPDAPAIVVPPEEDVDVPAVAAPSEPTTPPVPLVLAPAAPRWRLSDPVAESGPVVGADVPIVACDPPDHSLLRKVGELQPKVESDEPALPPTFSVPTSWLAAEPTPAFFGERRGSHPDDAYLFEDDGPRPPFADRGRANPARADWSTEPAASAVTDPADRPGAEPPSADAVPLAEATAASAEGAAEDDVDLTQLLEDLREWDTVLPEPVARAGDEPAGREAAAPREGDTGGSSSDLVAAAPRVHDVLPDREVPTPGEGSEDLDALFADLQRQTDGRAVAEQQLAAGRVFLAAGLVSEAARAFERASLEPRSRFASAQALAELHRSRGQLLEAVSWYEQAAMAPVPDAALKRAVLYDLAESLEALGETDRALGVLLDLLSQVEDYRDARARLDRLLRVDAGG